MYTYTLMYIPVNMCKYVCVYIYVYICIVYGVARVDTSAKEPYKRDTALQKRPII